MEGNWTKLHDEEFHNLYSSRNIIRMIKIKDNVDGACSTYGRKNTHKFLVGKPEGKRYRHG
jgi:hypothetical protein